MQGKRDHKVFIDDNLVDLYDTEKHVQGKLDVVAIMPSYNADIVETERKIDETWRLN